MLNEQTIEKLMDLHLRDMAKAFRVQMQDNTLKDRSSSAVCNSSRNSSILSRRVNASISMSTRSPLAIFVRYIGFPINLRKV